MALALSPSHPPSQQHMSVLMPISATLLLHCCWRGLVACDILIQETVEIYNEIFFFYFGNLTYLITSKT